MDFRASAACTTEVRRFSYKLDEFNWTIDNFSSKTGSIKSPTFKGLEHSCDWIMHLHFDGYREANKGYIALYLQQAVFSRPAIHVSFTFTVVNALKSASLISTGHHYFDLWRYAGSSKLIERSRILELSNGFLINNKLTVICELTQFEYRPLAGSEGLLSKQELLFLSKECSDCVFVCIDGIEVPAWRFPLISQSAVFRAMFQSETVEARTGRVGISDASSAVMQELVRYVSCGKVNNLNELGEELLTVADKYGIEELKESCVFQLRSSLSEDNVCGRLMLADRHYTKDLREAAIKFIKENVSDLRNAKNWKELFLSFPDLAVELYARMKP